MKIKKKFRDLLPPLSVEECAALEASIVAEGCREPLTVWGDVVVDGHNRLRICKKHSLPFKTRKVKFADDQGAASWIYATQEARRNWTLDQRRLARGRLYNMTKKAPHDGGKGKSRRGGQNVHHSENTVESIAANHGVDDRTILPDLDDRIAGNRREASVPR